ncbi:MAG: adenylate/guanylate cyclase domain-containing protein [Oscillatoria sp. PMC 1051.18]|nr:adenylate/guanylate cyclase domain-containing protein [Oscillatoria sp. PMC 1050.18]MEC5028832.1 adenylate/guanylate cyclase domain-containing protein [Oscillatoria sp. PMC 1051.18]
MKWFPDRLGKIYKFLCRIPAVAVGSLAVTGLLLGVRQFGWLQPLELAAYDRLMRSQSSLPPDSRLLVVAITEADLREQGQWPLSDRTLAQLLAELQKYQPKVIGLDLYRDIPQPPGNEALLKQLQEENVVAIEKLIDPSGESVPPPPTVPLERVGFNDILIDPDGVVRRNLLYAFTATEEFYSFSLRLSLKYFAEDNLQINPNSLQLGKTTFFALNADSGGYQTIDALGYQILLDYRSPNLVAPQVSLSEVLNGEIDLNLVKNKVVLIGSVAPSLKDFFPTPFSVAEPDNPGMPGVIIHAQMVSQILDKVQKNRAMFWFWSDWQEILWIFGWGLVGGAIALRSNNFLVLCLGEFGAIASIFGIGFVLFLHSGWVPLASPALAVIFTSGSLVTYEMQQARQQQKMVMKLLGQQTSPEVALALWKDRDRLLKSGILPGQKITATILFSDIRNFSTISEQRSPEEVMSWLNEYLTTMTQEVSRHHGVVNKFMGDGLMAVFGVPVPSKTPAEIAVDAQQAVSCALAMGDRLRLLNQNWQSKDLPVIQIRVGIFTGSVMVGSLGGKERLEYGVIGDSVNIASRLESCQKERQTTDCRILIAKETLVHLYDKFAVESWGLITLKGKTRKVDVYRVMQLYE